VLDRRHLSVQVPDPATGGRTTVVFDRDQAAYLFVMLSLHPGRFVDMPVLVRELTTGEGSHASTALLATVEPPGLVGYGLTFGVFCREDAAFTNPRDAATAARQPLPAFPTPVLSLVPQAPRIFDDCRDWDVGQADRSVRSDVPVLLLAGTLMRSPRKPGPSTSPRPCQTAGSCACPASVTTLPCGPTAVAP
jgi:hypothetical protein